MVMLGLVARLVGRTLELEAHAVGPVAHVVGILRVPAGVKAVTGGLLGGGVVHLQPVAAVGDGQADGGAALRQVQA
jgi:hypothetical protein